jgi:hypothetical protein
MRNVQTIKTTIILVIVMYANILSGQVFNGGSGDGFDNKVSVTTDFSDITSVENYKTLIKKVNAFPNPSDGRISVRIDAPVITNIKVTIIDIAGNRTELSEGKKQTDGNTVLIDLSDKPTGIYLIRMISDTNIYLAKINIY